MMLGRVVNRSITTNKDGNKNVLLLEVEITDPDDVQSIELFRQSGEDYNPPNDSRVIVLDLGDAYKVAVACDDGFEPEVDPGERELYAIDSSGDKSTFVKFNSDGTLNLNGLNDTAVRFSDLKIVLDEIVSAFNSLVANFNSHVHSGVTTGLGNTAIIFTPPETTISPDTNSFEVSEVPVRADGEPLPTRP